MNRRLNGLIIALTVALMVFGCSVFVNAETVHSGKCGANLTWTLDDQGTLTIAGSGSMYAYDPEDASPWESYYSKITSVTIEDGVTSIGTYAFAYCNLTNITIPNSVTSIGSRAFYGCGRLKSITIPDSVTSIEWGTFIDCNLTSITIPNSVTTIKDRAFEGCRSLTSIDIGNSVTYIGYDAFNGCSSLTSITVDANNKVYDSRNNCNAIIRTSSNCLILGCAGTVIPDSVTSIGDSAFYCCESLTSIKIPDSVTSIGDSAFSLCLSLTSINIPANVTDIGKYIFSFCPSLTSITVDDQNKKYDSRNNCNAIVETIDNTLICGCAGTVIPNSVKRIGTRAFYGCSSLTSITIPEGVTSIRGAAFGICKDLTSITIPKSVTYIAVDAFSRCGSVTIKGYFGSRAESFVDQKNHSNDIEKEETDYFHPHFVYLWNASDLSAKLSTKKYTYNGKQKNPALTVKTPNGKILIKNTDYMVTCPIGKTAVGTYTYKLTFKGDYIGTKYVSFKINPKGTYIKNLKRARKAFTVKWNRQSAKMSKSRITGYQIRYSRNSSMSNAKVKTVNGYSNTSIKIKKLKKKKKYYVQVRTYKTVNGTRYYSPWSTPKSVKTK